jgi:hypothetical protein
MKGVWRDPDQIDFFDPAHALPLLSTNDLEASVCARGQWCFEAGL